jgi:negative regulator of sigma E activity
MKSPELFDHRPDPQLGDALRAALERENHAAFVARVMANYDRALEQATVPTWEVLASWFRPGVAVAAALIAGFVFGQAMLTPASADTASIETAMAPAEGPGLAALVTADDPPDASVVFTSLVEPR